MPGLYGPWTTSKAGMRLEAIGIQRPGRGHAMPHDIVVGIDGSTEGLAAAHWAA
ncbi:hypothetical protein ABZ669_37350 [Streptomyces hirsutus]|uniref:hypothetical protein n=1 Tax=Streptomyces hirsutus TaxID=35620 RepID=UPI0033C97FA7